MPTESSPKALVLKQQNPSDVVTRCVSGIKNLPLEDLNYSCIEVYPTAQREVQYLLRRLSRAKRSRTLCPFHWEETLVLYDHVRIAEVPNEVDHYTVRLAHVPPESPTKLLEEDTLGFCWSKEQEALHVWQIRALVEDIDSAQNLDFPVGVCRSQILTLLARR